MEIFWGEKWNNRSQFIPDNNKYIAYIFYCILQSIDLKKIDVGTDGSTKLVWPISSPNKQV
jgi:hypothetical protein